MDEVNFLETSFFYGDLLAKRDVNNEKTLFGLWFSISIEKLSAGGYSGLD
jgi:hypothetical protein